MVQFDNQYRQIKVKIVYYGPALGGKTTCLQYVHRVTDPQRRTKLYSLNTASDRTLFFDLLSLNLGRIRGYRLAVQLYTVPGQVQYNATRRAVLSGADGVVFVADSQRDQQQPNIDSLENLRENMQASGLDFEEIPLVFQYNKRDLDPLLDVSSMEGDLNPRGAPSFPSVAITGEGVMDAFAAVSELTFAAVAERLGVGASARAVQRLQDQVREAIRPFVEAADSVELADEVEVTTPITPEGPDHPLEADALVGEAVRANMAMTDLNARLDTLSRELERKVEVLAAISDFGRSVGQEHDPRAVFRALLENAKKLLDVQAACVLVVPRSGPLREELLVGIEHDPLLATVDEAGQPLITALVEEHQPRLFARQLDADSESEGFEIEAVEAVGFGSSVVVPIVAQDRILGVLTGYAGQDRPPLQDDDLQLATVLASVAAVAHLGAESWSRLEDVNRDLEQQVAERTQDLRQKNRLVEDAYRELSELDRVKDDLMARVSSELKAPVASVLNAAKILAEQSTGSVDRGARFVTIIRDEAAKLSELIQSVVQASMLASGGEGAETQEVPIEELLRGAVAPLRDLAKERDVGFNILIPSGLKTVICDPDTVEVALRAVVKNALEFTDKGGSVKLEVRRTSRGEDAWLAIRVIDTGVGMGEQDLERAVDAFWQGGDAPGGGPRGLGLGLTIAQRVAENHGGSLKTTSTLGEGTEVTLSLPQQPG